eukprot:485796-Hanusia_phi.AAC.1
MALDELNDGVQDSTTRGESKFAGGSDQLDQETFVAAVALSCLGAGCDRHHQVEQEWGVSRKVWTPEGELSEPDVGRLLELASNSRIACMEGGGTLRKKTTPSSDWLCWTR